MFKRLWKKRSIQNMGWIMGGRIAQMAINLVVGLLTARYLGPSNYGVINYANAYIGLFMCFCTLGINSIIVKELIDNPYEEGTTIGTVLGLRAVSSFLSAGIIIAIVSIADAEDNITILSVTLCSLGLLFNIFETFKYWFQAKLMSKIPAIITTAAYAITSLYKLYLMATQKGVEYFALATSVDYVCVGIGLSIAYKKYGGRKLHFSARYGKIILSKSVHFIIPSLMVAIYGNTDRIMLKQMLGKEAAAYYSTAASLCNIWSFIPIAIIDSLAPSIIDSYKRSKLEFIKKNKHLYCIVFYFSFLTSLCIFLFAGQIVCILYGSAYLPSVAPLRIITWYTAFSYLGSARNTWVICEDRQKYLANIYILAVVANISLNFLFIPWWGTSGAAFASLITQIVTIFIVPLCTRELKENAKMMLEAIIVKGIDLKIILRK